MIIKCKKCQINLTDSLVELRDKIQLNENDKADFVPLGCYIVSDGEFYTDTIGKIIINKNDLINSKNHPNKSRLNGCCGLDGFSGLNKVCFNGHEIATELSDCWMPHSVIFDSNLTLIEK